MMECSKEKRGKTQENMNGYLKKKKSSIRLVENESWLGKGSLYMVNPAKIGMD